MGLFDSFQNENSWELEGIKSSTPSFKTYFISSIREQSYKEKTNNKGFNKGLKNYYY